MVTISSELRVGDVADSVPFAARVFETVGIDFCCRRDRSLHDAASVAGLDVEELLALLRRDTPIPSISPPADPKSVSLDELTRFISTHFHPRARRMLLDLTLLASQAASAHVSHSDDISALQDHITRLTRELIPHMRREEQYLFPYIDSFVREMGPDETIVVPLFGTVTYPLQHIQHDHARDLELVAGVRALTKDFTLPARACDPVRQLYGLLQQFETDLKQHVALENDILFPRAVEEERRAAARARR